MAQATVLFATQMGNSEEVAKQICRLAKVQAVELELHSMSELGTGYQLKAPGVYVFVLSSTGDGEVPDTARSLIKHLRSLSAGSLTGLKYALLGLGDSNFSTFQGGPKTLNGLLENLGAQEILPRGVADESSGIQKAVDRWLPDLWTALKREIASLAAGPQMVREISASGAMDNPRILQGRILEHRLISEPNAVKKLYEVTVDSCGFTYAAGSNISVYPENDPAAVSEVCARLAVDADMQVTQLNMVPASVRWRATLPMSLSALFLNFIELSAAVPKAFGQFFLEHLTDPAETLEFEQILQGSPGKLLPAQWSFVGLLRKFQSFSIGSLITLLPQLPPLRSRFYSISSSALSRPSSFTIAFGVDGVCTRYMESLLHQSPSNLPFSYQLGDSIFLSPVLSHSKILFVSTGTGISPFKGILAEMESRHITDKEVWVVHGCRQTQKFSELLNYDFVYEEEVSELVRKLGGKVTTAASRNGLPGPKYVQDALRSAGDQLRTWNQVALICGCFKTEEMKALLTSLSPGVRVIVEEWD